VGRLNQFNAAIFLYNENLGMLEGKAITGTERQEIEKFKIPVNADALIAKSFREDRIIHISDFKNPEVPMPGIWECWGRDYEQALSVPITNNKMVGIFLVASKEKMKIGEIKSLLPTVAHEAGLAIENAEAGERTKERAIKDLLTGLYSHRFFQEALELKFAEYERYEHKISLIMIDIDSFKGVNDTYGHLMGDKVLKRIGEIINNEIRASDIGARYGGEELAIILIPNKEKGLYADEEDARRVAERIREAVERAEFGVHNGGPLKVTISCGVAALSKEMNDKDALIEAADKALYVAKKTGKNRVITDTERRRKEAEKRFADVIGDFFFK
jgi:diguanylate cyclase (GGDEF)-like protein